jgi:glutamyl/glutaminyl-tRNA synthetase
MPQDHSYRGRLAPSPTGLLHLGHGRTFSIAHERAKAAGGTLVLRNDDLDADRVREEFVTAFLRDLQWLGLEWQEGPDQGGPYGPYSQSQRIEHYQAAFEFLRTAGHLFPCTCSRRDIQSALRAPHAGDDQPIYPGTCRARARCEPRVLRISWRFRVPTGRSIAFVDALAGPQAFVAGRDFGDFVVWRHDGLPSYQLACVVDDAAMGITEVVRGADLLVSTARQILLHEALGFRPPVFAHCPLMTDDHGFRLAKRHAALSLQTLRESGHDPVRLRRDWTIR